MTIRLATPNDAAQLLEIYNPFISDTIVTFELVSPSVEEFADRVREVLKTAPYLVCEHKGQILGYAYASAHRKRAAYVWTREVSVYVHADFRKRGVASGLYACLLQLIKAQGYQNALAGITLPNRASVGFHEAVGFKLIGVYHNIGYKMGQWCDVGWWELFLGEVESKQAPRLLSMEELQASEVWHSAINAGLSKLRP